MLDVPPGIASAAAPAATPAVTSAVASAVTSAAPPVVALSAPLLQTSLDSLSAIEIALQAYELVGAVIGVFIASLAYRGYRRNDSRPMLFIAVGFALALGLPLVLFPLYVLLSAPVAGPVFQALVQTLEIAGLLCIVYALWR